MIVQDPMFIVGCPTGISPAKLLRYATNYTLAHRDNLSGCTPAEASVSRFQLSQLGFLSLDKAQHLEIIAYQLWMCKTQSLHALSLSTLKGC